MFVASASLLNTKAKTFASIFGILAVVLDFIIAVTALSPVFSAPEQITQFGLVAIVIDIVGMLAIEIIR